MTPPPPQAASNVAQDITPMTIGQRIWVRGTETTLWDCGTITAVEAHQITMSTGMGGNTVQLVDRSLVFPANPRVEDDLTALHYLHEPAVLHNLAERAKLHGPANGDGQQKPYTFMANVLLAVNPLRELPHPCVSDFVGAASSVPHPFAVAEIAYQQMVLNPTCTEQPRNQSVVISGESGAGKTESSKIVLRHLTTRGLYGKHAKPHEIGAKYAADCKSGAHKMSLDARLIEQNPILEAFGNAQTLRNHNSSRFGKFLKLQFTNDAHFTLAGAYVETYLLEKSRLVRQEKGERNFHIFYQLITGASPSTKSQFQLTAPPDFAYLRHSDCYVAKDTDDASDFQAVVHGLRCVGVDDAAQHSMFAVVAALLHLGNVNVLEKDSDEGPVAEIATPSATLVATLLGISHDALARAITERTITIVGGESFTTRLSRQKAVYARDAVAKALYGRLFDWVLAQINTSLGHNPAPLPSIGVLDIFGFESFQRNDLEQLLINYTNEVLQASFNNQVFVAEMELYRREGLSVGTVQWPDNRTCVELLAGKSSGILALLDTATKNPQPSDDKFLAMLHATHATHANFPRPHKKDMQIHFVVRHFAGDVAYTVGQFIDKNNDHVPPGLDSLLVDSSNVVVASLAARESTVTDSLAKPRGGQSRVLTSVAAKFTRQIQTLEATLGTTRCSFIRCIKPNALMRPGSFDIRYVADQLKCQGILQTAEVLKCGLPTRVSYSDLATAYRTCMPADPHRLFENQSDASLITAILWAYPVPADSYQLGITRLFFRAGKIALLDKILAVDWATDGRRIVARMKLWLARRRWRVALANVLAQNAFQSLLAKIRMIRMRRAACFRIHRWWRAQRKKQIRKRAVVAAAVLVQALFRGCIARRELHNAQQEQQQREQHQREQQQREQQQQQQREQQQREQQQQHQREQQEQRQQQQQERHHVLEMDAIADTPRSDSTPRIQADGTTVTTEGFVGAHGRYITNHANTKMFDRTSLRLLGEERVITARLAMEREQSELMWPQTQIHTPTQTLDMVLEASKVHIAAISDELTQETLNDLEKVHALLLSCTIQPHEHESFVAFLLGEPADEELPDAQMELLMAQYTVGVFGVHLRCPVCGSVGHTAESDYCAVCGSQLTGAAGVATSQIPLYYEFLGNSLARGATATRPADICSSFGIESDRSITIHDGTFQTHVHCTRMVQDASFGEYTEYVLRCQWQSAHDSEESTTWLVSHRFQSFEKLHKSLTRKISPTATMLLKPPVECSTQLGIYLNQVLTMCAHVAGVVAVHELDRFLRVSSRVSLFRRHLAAVVAATNSVTPGTTDVLPLTQHRQQDAWNGVEAQAACERARQLAQLRTPLTEQDLRWTEWATAELAKSIREAKIDLRFDSAVQRHLTMCVALLPRLQIAANAENPFARAELIVPAVECEQRLATAINEYNASLHRVMRGADVWRDDRSFWAPTSDCDRDYDDNVLKHRQ